MSCIRFPIGGLALVFAVLSQVSLAQTINLVAGTGASSYTGDGGDAKNAALFNPRGVAADGNGNLYIADMYNHRVRKVDARGVITTVAGTGILGFSGDGGLATAAEFNFPRDVGVDRFGNLYIVDMYNHRIRKVDTRGIVTTVAGNGGAGSTGDGGQATNAQINLPNGIAVDAAGSLFLTEEDGHRARKIDAQGIITTVAGTGTAGYTGDGGQGARAQLNTPNGIAVDGAGIIYIADGLNHRVRKVALDGVISTVAGTGTAGYGGDGGAATKAMLNRPRAVLVDGVGNLYVSDSLGYRIRKVSTAGYMSTVAGDGTSGYGGDGGAATGARINQPRGLAMNQAGNLFFADADNHRVRVIALGAPAEDPRPVITAVFNGVGFQAPIAASTWVTIMGSKLAATTRPWNNSDFPSNKLPTQLDGIQVNINGKAAFVYFISPGQINVLAPADETVGRVQVEVITPQGRSLPVEAQKNEFSPGLFMYNGTTSVIGVALDGTLLGRAGIVPGVNIRPAEPNEVILLFGSGFGLTSPPLPPGEIVAAPAPLAGGVVIRIGNVEAAVSYAGQIGSGLCQFNVRVPDSLRGDQLVVAEINGVRSQANAVLTIRAAQ